MPFKDGDIRILTHFQRTNAVGKAQQLGGTDGDRLKGSLLRKPSGHADAHIDGQPSGSGGGILGQTEVDAGLFHLGGGILAAAPDFHLDRVHQQRTYHTGAVMLLEHLENLISLGGVLDGIIQMIFLCNADGGGDVVGAVAVDTHLHLAPNHRYQRIQLKVGGGRFGGIAFRCFQLVGIYLGVVEGFPQQRRHGHSGLGHLFAVAAIAVFGVFSQRHLHLSGAGDDDIKEGIPVFALKADAGAADDVGGTGTGIAGSETGFPSFGDGQVMGIDGVDGPQLGGDGVGDLVAVPDVGSGGGLGEGGDMGVGVDEAGGYPFAGDVHQLGVLGNGYGVGGANGTDLAVLYQYDAVFEGAAGDGDNFPPLSAIIGIIS